MSALCGNPECGHTHCWHTGSGVTLTMASYPPQYQETCCHCGAVQWVAEQPPPIPPGHGPYHPNAPLVARIGYSQADPTRNCGCRPENGGSGVCHCILGSNITYTASTP